MQISIISEISSAYRCRDAAYLDHRGRHGTNERLPGHSMTPWFTPEYAVGHVCPYAFVHNSANEALVMLPIVTLC